MLRAAPELVFACAAWTWEAKEYGTRPNVGGGSGPRFGDLREQCRGRETQTPSLTRAWLASI